MIDSLGDIVRLPGGGAATLGNTGHGQVNIGVQAQNRMTIDSFPKEAI